MAMAIVSSSVTPSRSSSDGLCCRAAPSRTPIRPCLRRFGVAGRCHVAGRRSRAARGQELLGLVGDRVQQPADLVTSMGAYAVYLAIIAGRLQSTPVAKVPYAWVLLWTALASVVASTLGRTLVETVSPSDSRRTDVRDKEIYRFGEYASRWFIVAGAAAGLFMALVKVDYFWIANVIYLGFVGWAAAGSTIKLVAYRRGL
jgi:hypothetical protein